ncbi:unnamed protein product [Orchesella dallaii]|uniref:Venom dipeptidyl peptidase 4 n=1 Tax=Orchesella dallaii TaxID=48710 RepID=A0ABP1RCN5_9HEXA
MNFKLNLRNSLVVFTLLGTLGAVFSAHNSFAGGALPPRTLGTNQEELEPITLEDILGGVLSARGFSGQWVPDQDDLIQMTEGDLIVRYNIANGDKTNFTNLKEIRDAFESNGGTGYSGVTFSNDGNYALIEHGRSSLWRYSSVAKYDIYDVGTKSFIKKLQPDGSPEDDQPVLQLVKWSPTGNGIAFVYGYNIYYRRDSAAETEVRQVTIDGSEEGAIYNGITDWVYEEEMFFTPTAFWISPNGENLAFVQFDNSEVMSFKWPIYGEPDSNQSYPEYRSIRYPKAGTPNPTAVVKVVSLTDVADNPRNLTYNVTLPDEHLIGTALWASNDQLMVITLDRVQTSSEYHFCNAASNACLQIHSYEQENGWIDINTPKVSADGTEFIFIEPTQPQSDDRTYKHIVSLKSDGSLRPLTSGRLSVDSILGWDTDNSMIYFSGSFGNDTVADPTETQIYSVPSNGTDQPIRCITCPLTNGNDGPCRDNSASFSAKYTRFIHRCNGPDVPEITTRITEGGEVVDNPGPTLVDNAALRETLSKKAVPTTQEYVVNVGEDSNGVPFEAKARLYFPADYDESKKYPLLISVYGGPGSQNLGQGYGVSWETSLVSSKNIIFGYIDGRGTAKQSTDHLFTMHRNLGTVEIEDQITVGKWLVDNVPGIDANQTSIWGWSYGGYATSKVMQKDTQNVYKCGISVAPVTSWRYYDTIYTERYMGRPTEEDNVKAYMDSAVTLDVENFKKKQFMLVHGNADDNVHYQQSMILARALEKNDVFFHQLSYPDENHSIGSVRPHLYHSLERFLFNECYSSASQPVVDPTTTPNPGTTTLAGAATFSHSLTFLLINFVFVISRYAF